ncbi:MAG: hypothetical protein A2086_06170 [Spirochaetes bacterium GWD1_27_9]|nr:MAG: hypothetical protein A2Z98_16825 [Spirochaetes bacterium GWB1_27_13]OHD27841.1 MAG: hypothetical protein A2Y34_15565 [Spirochaetes bacterium GWC1_27_15]OHD30853.1 MAG: hypothetical protein A2086_06170 [Spirochaetes bacterium GWD1_27_9]
MYNFKEEQVNLFSNLVINNIQMVSSLSKMQLLDIQNDDIKEQIKLFTSRILTANLIQKFYCQINNYKQIDIYDCFVELIKIMRSIYSINISVNIECRIKFIDVNFLNSIMMITNELLITSISHREQKENNENIYISFSQLENNYILLYKDNFVDYKICTMKQGGLNLIDGLINQHFGKIKYFTEDQGVKLIINIPTI